MKRILLSAALVFFCFQLSIAQQIINTNTKSTCTYNGTNTLQNCTDESVNAIFTFKENTKIFTHSVNGVEVIYTIVSREYHNSYWSYRISNAENVFDLMVDQRSKVFCFCPVGATEGAVVYKYSFN